MIGAVCYYRSQIEGQNVCKLLLSYVSSWTDIKDKLTYKNKLGCLNYLKKMDCTE